MGKASKRRTREKLNPVRPETLTDYWHLQPATLLIALICLPLVICFAAAYSHPEYRIVLLSSGAILFIAAILFSSLTTKVNGDTLHWSFGPGLIRKKIQLSEIASAEITRSTWIDGWGIHYTKRGWLYNVSGRDALLIKEKSGKSFLIGSNDVVGLWEAIHLRINA